MVRKDEAGRRKKKCDRGKLFGLRKDIFETHAGPVDRTCVGRKWDRIAFDSPAKPVEKLFFSAFDNHRITSDAERGQDRPMRLEFAREPVGPVRHCGDSVNMSDGGPDESVF